MPKRRQSFQHDIMIKLQEPGGKKDGEGWREGGVVETQKKEKLTKLQHQGLTL